MSKENLKGMFVITELPKNNTQSECKEQFVDVLRNVLSDTTLIDLKTPTTPNGIEPEWWLDMMTLQKNIITLIEKYKLK